MTRLLATFIVIAAVIAALEALPQAAAVTPVAASRAALEQACSGKDGWADAAPPARVFGNTYYVGTCGVAVLLVVSPSGHVLIDSGPEDAVPSVLANIRALGFKPREVKLIVGSHEHIDHMGGLAALRSATGASIGVREPARAVLESGKANADDPQRGLMPDAAPVTVGRIVRDGETVRVGALRLNAAATPGHTDGGTSWSWRTCEGKTCRTIAYVDSMSPIAREGYRFSDHPERVLAFRMTFKRVAAMPCDILVTPHPSASKFFERIAGREPLVDAGACARLADRMSGALDARLLREQSVK